MATEIDDDDDEEEEEQYDDEFDEQFEYDMTTIRMQRHSSQRKWFWAALMLILVAVAALLVFVKPLGLSQNVRKSPSKTDTNNVTPKDNNASRDITFEVTNLDGQEGSTDTFVVRTQPDWSPLGVEQFHVSYTQKRHCVCNVECYILTLIISLNLLYILLLSRN